MADSVQDAGGFERLPALDLLRGVAILAILPANIPYFSGATEWMDARWSDGSWADRLVVVGTLLVIDLKFITLLSMLFGAGMELQRARAAERPFRFAGYYLWRQALLFLIGLAHGILLWYGDILVPYAVLSVVALLFAMLIRGRGLFWAVVVLESIFVGLLLLWSAATLAGVGGTPPKLETPVELKQPYAVTEIFRPVDRGLTPQQKGEEYQRRFLTYFSEANQVRIYREGAYSDMVVHRAIFAGCGWLAALIFIGPHLLACFLLGAWFVRIGLFQQPQAHASLLRRLVVVGLAIAVPLHLVAAALYLRRGEGSTVLDMVGEQVLNMAGALPQSLAYLGLLILWQQSGTLPGLQRRFRAVGRMALTCYLTETALCTTLFYSYGLALFGRLSRAQDALVVLGVWLILLLAAPLWLRVFTMGPVEWVWRCLADFRLRPLLRTRREAA